jgi:RimJ/RimL family protein N-acetyltransferase
VQRRVTADQADEAPVPKIRTERLLLREWCVSDRLPFAAINADPIVMEHFPRRLSADETSAFIDRIVARWMDDGYGLWAVERVEDRTLIGFVGLTSPPWEAAFTPAVEIGWRLARGAWGKGYATEAARATLRFGFETLRLDEILSWTVPANTRSRAVMERLGVAHDPADDFDHPGMPVGSPLRRHVLYRLSRTAWEGR